MRKGKGELDGGKLGRKHVENWGGREKSGTKPLFLFLTEVYQDKNHSCFGVIHKL